MGWGDILKTVGLTAVNPFYAIEKVTGLDRTYKGIGEKAVKSAADWFTANEPQDLPGKPFAQGMDPQLAKFLADVAKPQGGAAPTPAPSGGSTGGARQPAFDAAAYLREIVGQIDLDYAKDVAKLDERRSAQMQRLMEQQNEFKNLLARNRQTYEQGAAMAAQEIANRATAGQQRATELANQLANAMQLQGVSAQPLQAQAQLQQQLMQESQRYQQDYQTRMAQLAAQRFADAERSSELVRQGAAGQLENQFTALQSALQRQRLQDILSAQEQIAKQEIEMQKAAAAAARAAASGGGNSLKNTLLELQIAEKARKLQNPFASDIGQVLGSYSAFPPEIQQLIDPFIQDALGLS